MRWILLVVLTLCGAAARAEDIVEVLQRSQQTRLDALLPVGPESDAAHTLQSNFEQLLRFTGIEQPVELRVIEGESIAETLLGKVVVVNVVLAQRPQAEQLFILAHELGHVVQGHQDQMGQLFLKWVPGAVVQEHTDAVAPMLGREASGLAHRQEFSADAFALRTLCAMGYAREEVVNLFVRMGLNQATATHPAGSRRMLALRVAPLDEPQATQAAALSSLTPR
jgi:predicted Zn-dependent protease